MCTTEDIIHNSQKGRLQRISARAHADKQSTSNKEVAASYSEKYYNVIQVSVTVQTFIMHNLTVLCVNYKETIAKLTKQAPLTPRHPCPHG